MNLLHVDLSIRGADSVSRKLSADIVTSLKIGPPKPDVSYRDLAAAPAAHLSGAYLMAKQDVDGRHAPALQANLAAE